MSGVSFHQSLASRSWTMTVPSVSKSSVLAEMGGWLFSDVQVWARPGTAMSRQASRDRVGRSVRGLCMSCSFSVRSVPWEAGEVKQRLEGMASCRLLEEGAFIYAGSIQLEAGRFYYNASPARSQIKC